MDRNMHQHPTTCCYGAATCRGSAAAVNAWMVRAFCISSTTSALCCGRGDFIIHNVFFLPATILALCCGSPHKHIFMIIGRCLIKPPLVVVPCVFVYTCGCVVVHAAANTQHTGKLFQLLHILDAVQHGKAHHCPSCLLGIDCRPWKGNGEHGELGCIQGLGVFLRGAVDYDIVGSVVIIKEFLKMGCKGVDPIGIECGALGILKFGALVGWGEIMVSCCNDRRCNIYAPFPNDTA